MTLPSTGERNCSQQGLEMDEGNTSYSQGRRVRTRCILQQSPSDRQEDLQMEAPPCHMARSDAEQQSWPVFWSPFR